MVVISLIWINMFKKLKIKIRSHLKKKVELLNLNF